MTGSNGSGGGSSDARRVAIVTGSAQGIGRAIALRLARDGFDLGLADLERSQTQLKGVVEEVIKEGGGKIKAIAVPCDVSQKKDVDGLVERTVAELGRLDGKLALRETSRWGEVGGAGGPCGSCPAACVNWRGEEKVRGRSISASNKGEGSAPTPSTLRPFLRARQE